MGKLDRLLGSLLVAVFWPAALVTAQSGFIETFEGVTPPALPPGWVTSVQGSGQCVTSTGNPDSFPNSAHIESLTAPSSLTLDSPPIPIATTSAQLRFRHQYALAVDPGAVRESIPVAVAGLEVSVNGGSFIGLQSWVGEMAPPHPYSTVVAALPAYAAGGAVVIRWHLSTSVGPNFPGSGSWFVDSIRICDGYPCNAIPLPKGLDVDTAGNGVLEGGETVDLDTSYYNNGAVALNLTGAVTDIGGAPGTTFQVLDAAATFGSIPPSVLRSCVLSNDCYQVSLDVPAARPAPHWDGQFSETLSNGQIVNWALHVGESFPDVPASNPFYAFIENLFHNGVTGGCSGTDYCPDGGALRQQMAVFVLKAKYGPAYVPPHCAGVFTDVACPGPFTDWIEDLHARGIVAGCGAGTAYCPGDVVSRQQMAVFLLRTLFGSAYTPPACQGTFADVPCSNGFAPWIEDLSGRNITAGCGGGNYCPLNPTTRGQMAPFLVKTFGLRLYGYN